MPYDDVNAGKGSLSRNAKKYGDSGLLPGANPQAPDYTGSLKLQTPQGEAQLFLSGWVRQSADGRKFVGLRAEYPHAEARRLVFEGAEEAAPLPKFPATGELPPVPDDDPLPF